MSAGHVIRCCDTWLIVVRCTNARRANRRSMCCGSVCGSSRCTVESTGKVLLWVRKYHKAPGSGRSKSASSSAALRSCVAGTVTDDAEGDKGVAPHLCWWDIFSSKKRTRHDGSMTTHRGVFSTNTHGSARDTYLRFTPTGTLV